MRYFADALSEHSRLVPYVYSYADADGLRFLVEIAGDVVRVLDMEGAEAARFTDGEDGMDFYLDPDTVRWRQLNALLYLTTQDNRPMVLKRDGDGVWTLEAWEFKHHPWRYVNEKRDHPLVLTCKPVLGDVRYTVEFDPEEEPRESAIESADLLRASFWLEQQEAFAKGETCAGMSLSQTDCGQLPRGTAWPSIPTPPSNTTSANRRFPQMFIRRGWMSPLVIPIVL